MNLLRAAAKNVANRTNGTVKVKIYPGGVMGDDKAVMRKMRVGQLHGAVVTSGALAQNYKDIGLYNLPLLFRDEAEVDHVRKVMDAELIAGLRKKKFVGFGFAEVGFAYPMTQSAATSVADLRGRKVWAPDNDPASLRAFNAFRISPIPLPIADVLAGLQTGLIDSIGSPPVGAIALQWHTQVQHAIELPLMYTYGLFAMTDRAFKRLSADEQRIVEAEMGAAVAAADKSARRDHNSAKTALAGQGIRWAQPSAVEYREWTELAQTATQKLVDEGFISEQAYNRTLTLLTEYRAGSD